jgi:hypothetical protein
MKMKKLVCLMVVVAVTSPTYAATMFTEDFSGGVLPANMQLTTAGQAGTPVDHVSFAGGIAAWENATEYRQYMQTTEADYSTVDFCYEATVTCAGGSAWSRIWFGMGVGEARYDWWYEPGRPVIGSIVQESPDASYYAAIYDNANNIDDGRWWPDTLGKAGTGTHRLRMDWNATTKIATFSIDQNYTGGAFVAEFSYTLNGASSIIPFDGTNSHLFVGGGQGMIVDNIVVTPEPATMLLLGLGGLAVARRKHVC